MPEQFGLDQRLGKRCTVHRHQRPAPARTQAVKSLCNKLFSGPALAHDENRPVERRSPTGPLDRIEKGRRLADKLTVAFHFSTLGIFHHVIAINTIAL